MNQRLVMEWRLFQGEIYRRRAREKTEAIKREMIAGAAEKLATPDEEWIDADELEAEIDQDRKKRDEHDAAATNPDT